MSTLRSTFQSTLPNRQPTASQNGKIRLQPIDERYPNPTRGPVQKTTFVKNRIISEQDTMENLFHLNPDKVPPHKETYGFKSTKTAPKVKELNYFEKDLADLMELVLLEA